MAKILQHETSKNVIVHCLKIMPIVCCIISGISALGNIYIFDNMPDWAYILLMIISFALTIVFYSDKKHSNNPLGYSKLIATLSLFGSIILACLILSTASNGSIIFGIEPSSIGPFLNNILIAVFAVNLILLFIQMFRYVKKDEAAHWGWFISIAAIYLASLYGDCLHNMNSFQGMVKEFVIRTLIVFIVAGISMLSSNFPVGRSR